MPSVERILKFSLARNRGGKKRKGGQKQSEMLETLSKDTNAVMNYSVMTTRSDQKKKERKKKKKKKEAALTSAWCSEGAEQSGPLMPERL